MMPVYDRLYYAAYPKNEGNFSGLHNVQRDALFENPFDQYQDFLAHSMLTENLALRRASKPMSTMIGYWFKRVFVLSDGLRNCIVNSWFCNDMSP